MKRMLGGLGACGVSLLILAGCAPGMLPLVSHPAPGPALRETPAVSAESLHGSGTVYLVPLGDFPIAVVQDLVKYYHGKFGLVVH
ncbi:MAG: hypothetical protein M3Y56_08180, partial [Armatimonadota bacterium]|nr:hypothetical protein [Armatimonadota bacterium]